MQLLQNLQNLDFLHVDYCKGLEQIAADDDGVGQGGGEGIQLASSERPLLSYTQSQASCI